MGFVLYAGTGNFSQQQAAALELVRCMISRLEMDHAFVIAAGGNRPWSDGNLKWENDVETLSKNIKALDKNTGFSDPFGYELQHRSNRARSRFDAAFRRWQWIAFRLRRDLADDEERREARAQSGGDRPQCFVP